MRSHDVVNTVRLLHSGLSLEVFVKKKIGLTSVLASLVVMLALTPEPAQVDIEGTYRLVSRELSDGTTVSPPDIQGLLNYEDGYRNFNIYWTDAEGNATSISVIAEYEITADTYTETNVFTLVNDEIEGTGVSYDLSSTSGSSPVTAGEGTLSFTLPLRDEPAVVFTDDSLAATREGEFVDHWVEVDDD